MIYFGNLKIWLKMWIPAEVMHLYGMENSIPVQINQFPQPPSLSHLTTIVVYFDQQMHACTCVLMVKNNKKQKRYKIVKKVLLFSKVT